MKREVYYCWKGGSLNAISKIETIILGMGNMRDLYFPNLQVVCWLNESERQHFDVLSSRCFLILKTKSAFISAAHTNTRGGFDVSEDEGLGALIIERSAVWGSCRGNSRLSKECRNRQELPETMLDRVSPWIDDEWIPFTLFDSMKVEIAK